MLPAAIQEQLYRFWSGELPLPDFEQWVYSCAELESALGADDYLALISFPFNQSGAGHELRKLLRKHINLGEVEKRRLLRLLYTAQSDPAALPEALVEFYGLYCRGYYFLETLGLGYGLAIDCALEESASAATWDDLPVPTQQELLASFQPGLNAELAQVVHWLESGQVVPTGERDELDYWLFADHRPATDKAVSTA